jgi:hypothetical protein
VIDCDVVGGGEFGEGRFIVGRRERREEKTAAGAEVVSSESVERRERRMGVNDGEETVAGGINGDSEEGSIGGESGVGDEGFNDAGVGNGGDYALTERSDEEVLRAWFPRERFRVEIE